MYYSDLDKQATLTFDLLPIILTYDYLHVDFPSDYLQKTLTFSTFR